ncbi:SRPBCC family protein [Roseivirga sp.]|uniref:SRPBCC family protein n=1 Tax=Roseivirga sp. TaxID=1964215 RepID=UPI003B8B32D5
MPQTNIQRSKHINASAEKIFSILNDFNHWSAWSPWLIMEPGVKVTIREDAKYYEWKGKRTGEGNMAVTKEVANESIDYDLEFLTPWKSQSKVRFEIKPEAEGCKVTWYMDGSLPFFMFWMKKMMEAFVGMDYERGLNLLKEYVEDGAIKSKLEFKGESNYPGTKYIGVNSTCTMEKIGDQMGADFGKLHAYKSANEGTAFGDVFCIYHKWDMVKRQVSYTACLGVDKAVNGEAGFVSGEVPATKVYVLRHIGPYEHLGNAWSTLESMKRGKEFKHVKGIHPFEHYVNDPQEVSPEELITDIHFAIK